MSKRSKQINLELLFTALADRTRLRLLNLMGDDEVCVCFFVEVLQTNQPKISRHLAFLRRAGIVEARRDGLWMHYRIAETGNEDINKILYQTRQAVAKDPEMRADRERMVSVCCGPNLPANIKGAPIPASLADYQCRTKC
jgi:ArsR family transcriptional regulator